MRTDGKAGGQCEVRAVEGRRAPTTLECNRTACARRMGSSTVKQ